jgi:hypothetical protein
VVNSTGAPASVKNAIISVSRWKYKLYKLIFGVSALQAQHLHQVVPTKTTALSKTTERSTKAMSKPIEKTRQKSLVHRPSDVLDSFGHYDAENRNWLQFDESVSEQIRNLEAKNQQYIRVSFTSSRHSSR